MVWRLQVMADAIGREGGCLSRLTEFSGKKPGRPGQDMCGPRYTWVAVAREPGEQSHDVL
jgi:hypothetical protein